MLTTCPQCQQSIRSEAKFCPHCGATAPPRKSAAKSEGIPCPACRQTTRIGAKFCPHCGYTLNVSSASDHTFSAPVAPPPASSTAGDGLMLAGRKISNRILGAIVVFLLIVFLSLALLSVAERPEADYAATPNVAATLTIQAASPTPHSTPATAVRGE